MVSQVACVLAPVVGNGQSNNPYRPQFADIMQDGESWSSAIDSLPIIGDLLADDNTDTLNFENIPAPMRLAGQVALGVCIVYVQADSVRLDTADAAAAYHVFWRWTINRSEKPALDTEKSPFKQPILAELTALSAYLALQTGKTTNTINQWVANNFGVTVGQMANWAIARKRFMTVTKLGQAFADWNKAKSELDTIGS